MSDAPIVSDVAPTRTRADFRREHQRVAATWVTQMVLERLVCFGVPLATARMSAYRWARANRMPALVAWKAVKSYAC